jgi:hypothetical protein
MVKGHRFAVVRERGLSRSRARRDDPGVPHGQGVMAFAADTTAPPKTGERKGRGFFLTLIIVSGIVILGLAFLFFKGKDFFIFTWQKFVIEKALVRALPPEYTVEEVEPSGARSSTSIMQQAP